jgi:hypothetical protein
MQLARDQTDLDVAAQGQLALAAPFIGERAGTRTRNRPIKSRALYLLSYVLASRRAAGWRSKRGHFGARALSFATLRFRSGYSLKIVVAANDARKPSGVRTHTWEPSIDR